MSLCLLKLCPKYYLFLFSGHGVYAGKCKVVLKFQYGLLDQKELEDPKYAKWTTA